MILILVKLPRIINYSSVRIPYPQYLKINKYMLTSSVLLSQSTGKRLTVREKGEAN